MHLGKAKCDAKVRCGTYRTQAICSYIRSVEGVSMVEEFLLEQEQRRYDNQNRKILVQERQFPLIWIAFQVTSSETDLRQPETHRFRSQINPIIIRKVVTS